MLTEQEQNERNKYQTMWDRKDYRRFSPGERIVERFHLMALLKGLGVETVLDAGCGSGKLMRKLLEDEDGQFDVNGFDIAANCLDTYFDPFKEDLLKVGVLWDSNDFNTLYDAVICTDVLEHIPTDKIPLVLKNFSDCSGKFCLLGICLVPDNFGPGVLGEHLHLTVKPPGWWLAEIYKAGFKNVHFIVDQDPTGRDYWLHVLLPKTEAGTLMISNRSGAKENNPIISADEALYNLEDLMAEGNSAKGFKQ